MWRLDILEVKFNGASPRFNKTKILLNSKKNDKLLRKLPTSKEDAESEILTLKSSAFESKYHGSFKNLYKEVKKQVKSDIHKYTKDKKPENESLIKFLNDEEILKNLVTSKLVKTVQLIILTNSQLKKTPPKYLPNELVAILMDKSHNSHPLRFFINYCQNNKAVNTYVSNLWNQKGMKPILSQVEWSLKLVRGVTKAEKDERRKQLGKKVDSDDEDESDENDDEEDYDEDNDNATDGNGKGSDDELMVYDEVNDEPETFELNPDINYNEVTDEEPSDDEDIENDDSENDLKSNKSKKDDFFESDSDDESTEKKYNLPELTTGYFSGGSDDEDNFDVDNDKVVKKVTTQRKNRRGQRARQKIWEMKYGKSANHKAKEIEAYQNERKRRQLEFEERERKRAAKARPTGSNSEPLGQRKERKETDSSNVPQEIQTKKETALGSEHPSWKAKKIAEEKLKNVKFQGKKITFD